LKNGAEAMHAENQERITSGRKPKASSFLIKIYYENNECVYEIQDNGPGMTENIKNRIFEPFFTTKGSEKGTGLGLSVSYFIITDNHQGKLFVESEINIGTKFTIVLPLQKEENAE
jgi:signal transduction histidine kinase